MNIQLTGLKISDHMSEETVAYTATILGDGVKIATARNDGRGGATMCFHLPGHREVFNQAEAYCADRFDGLGGVCDELVDAHLRRKSVVSFIHAAHFKGWSAATLENGAVVSLIGNRAALEKRPEMKNETITGWYPCGGGTVPTPVVVIGGAAS